MAGMEMARGGDGGSSTGDGGTTPEALAGWSLYHQGLFQSRTLSLDCVFH